MNIAVKKDGGGHFDIIRYWAFAILLTTLIISCRHKTYERGPYSERISWDLLAHGLDVSDPPPKAASLLIEKAKKIHYFYKPEQSTAFPIADHRGSVATAVVTDRNEILRTLRELRKANNINRSFGKGTLHVIIEFNEMPTQSAYLIIYLNGATITPVFNHDSASFSCGSFLEWLTENYSHIIPVRLNP